jgi:hypothetical protein
MNRNDLEEEEDGTPAVIETTVLHPNLYNEL